MSPATDSAADVPVNYVLDVMGNVLFLQTLRGVVAHIPVWIENAPDVNFDRVAGFFQQVAHDFAPQIHNAQKISSQGVRDFWEIRLDYKTKSIVATALQEKFCSEEETLIQRLRESPTRELVMLQMKNFFTKVTRIREVYAQSALDVRQDPKKFYAAVQKDFRKAPVSREFVQYIVDTRSVGQPRPN